MTILRKALIVTMAIVTGLVFQLSTVSAQSYPGRLHSGHVLGNPSASEGDGQDASMSSMLDRALGSTPGSCAYRSSGGWTVNPGCGGSGTGTSCVQDFLASVGFTPGATTTLTTTCAASAASGIAIYFDGVYQNSNTWSLSGLTVTFDAVIPIGAQVVEFRVGVPGSGVVGPSSSVVNDLAIFSTTGGGAIVDSGVNAATTSFRGKNPTSFYVATTGSDSNPCLTSGAPCLTIQHAVNVALSYDLQGSPAVINLAAGTYPAGATISGTTVGSGSGQGGYAASIQLIGAGSGVTNIYTYGSGGPGTHTGGQCSALPYPLITSGATVGIGSIMIESSCAGAATIFAATFSNIYTVNGDVILFSEYSGLNSVFEVFDHASFSDGYGFTIEGNAAEAIAISSESAVYLTSSGTYSVTGNYSNAWVNVFDHSFFNWGEGTIHVTGSVNGPRYQLLILSEIDSEQNTTPLPGNASGLIEMGSYYYASSASTATINSHSGGTPSLAPGAGDLGGTVEISGDSSSASGNVVINIYSQLYGPTGGGGMCTASISDGGTAWNARATVFAFYNLGAGTLKLVWDNNGVDLVTSDTYDLTYICQ